MEPDQLLINGHFRRQRITGVQRYAHEVVSQFNKKHVPYGWVQPPNYVRTDSLRQLWMQGVMPFKVPGDKILWSPTNIGPAMCENQVLTLHDIADQLHPEWFSAKYSQWRRFILPRLINRVRRIITVSDFSKQTIVSHYPKAEGKVEVIYNGVRTDYFYPRDDEEITQLKNKLNLNKPFILSVGSLEKRKNVGGLIKAWNRLPAEMREEFELVITGESARKFIFKLEESLDKSIRFTGYIKDAHLPVLYSAATAFVYPSLFEGFGLPILEAMACNTPVITSNTTALKELAQDKAVTVDNPANIEALANAINTMLASEELRNHYIEAGKNYVKTFSWDRTARETKKVLEDCIV